VEGYPSAHLVTFGGMDRALRAYAGWAVVLVLVAALATGLSSAAAQEDAVELSDPVAFAETT
jgi:hypothetical protein